MKQEDKVQGQKMVDKKKTMYIETTIPSYATARATNDLINASRQELTKMFWEKDRNNYDLFISRFVIDECANGDKDAAKKRLDLIKDIPLLAESPEIDALAELYKHILSIPQKAEMDAYHMATAVIYKIDYVLTWNFAHLGFESYLKLLEYNIKHDFKTPILTNPDILNSEEKNDVL
jgi:hypothetical protein